MMPGYYNPVDPLGLMQGGMAPMQQPMQQPGMSQGAQPAPETNHIMDTINQYTQNQQNNAPPDFVSQALSGRFQPTAGDTAMSAAQNTQAILMPHVFSPTTPEQYGAQRMSAEMSPAMDQAKMGMMQAESLPQKMALLKYQYENNPEMAMNRAMANYMSGFGGSSPQGQQTEGGTQQNGQSRFNPMGAMLAKQFGMNDMQIGANGQPELIPGVVSPGQKEQDTNFAQAWQTYANSGGAERTNLAIKLVDDTINKLRKGEVTSGGLADRLSMGSNGEPSALGKVLSSPLLVARNQIGSTILPQAKALFGARVTNFDAQSLVNSKGIDPMADTATNIDKLERLKQDLLAGQSDLMNSGRYFTQHGTLNGYQAPILGNNDTSQAQSATPSLEEGKTGTLPNGQKVIVKGGQIVPLK